MQCCKQGYIGDLIVIDRQTDKQEDRQASNDPGTQEKQVNMQDTKKLNH